MTAVAKLDEIMEKAQEFASTWSLVGGKFDDGTLLAVSQERKEELRALIRATLSPAELGGVEAVARLTVYADTNAFTARIHDVAHDLAPGTYDLYATPRAAEAVAWAGISPLGTHCVSVSKEAIEIQCYGRGWVVTPLYASVTRTIEAASVDTTCPASALTPPSAKGENK